MILVKVWFPDGRLAFAEAVGVRFPTWKAHTDKDGLLHLPTWDGVPLKPPYHITVEVIPDPPAKS